MEILNSDYIYNSLIKRGVTRLCHFTKIKSLVHILADSQGILATQFIQSDVRKQNDEFRVDGVLDYVCCSIEYPNVWYWERVKQRDEDAIFKEWAILCIDPKIIQYKKIKFCPCNAAYGGGQYITQDFAQFDELFDQDTTVGQKKYYRSPEMLSCCPTDGQAEILIEQNIPLRFIKAIIVGTENIADQINAVLKIYKCEIDLYVAPDVCNANWSDLVRQGKRPTEIKYNVDEKVKL